MQDCRSIRGHARYAYYVVAFVMLCNCISPRKSKPGFKYCECYRFQTIKSFESQIFLHFLRSTWLASAYRHIRLVELGLYSTTRWLHCMECHNTVFDWKRSTICAQAVYLHWTIPRATCLQLSDVSVICRVTYFQFPIQVCFSSMSVRQAAQRRQRRIGLRNIGHRTLSKIWALPYLFAAYSPEEWFWIDSNGKNGN